MNTVKLLCGAALLAFAASCSQDEVELNKISTSNTISYKVDTDKMSRATSAYENGTDISTFNVSAWLIKDSSSLPGYGSPNTGNALYFLNDVLTRASGSGTFNYQSDARYWPNNGELLDFFALVDNDKFGPFSFAANGESIPGVNATIKQGGLDEMPDMLYAVSFNEKAGDKQAQQNVSFKFDHAFAKVVVTGEVKNKNLHVVITDMEIHGIREAGNFFMPYKSGSGSDIVKNPAHWVTPDVYTYIDGLMANNGKDEVVIDKSISTEKQLLVGEGDKANQLLVLPGKYEGRNNSKCQTYIQLKCYAYNKSGATLDEDTDALIYGKFEVDGNSRKPVPMIIKIPIEFDWKMGTINRYNILFDCGNGGQTDPSDNPSDPDKPAFMRIGYEVEVNDWVEGVNNPDREYPDNLKDKEDTKE